MPITSAASDTSSMNGHIIRVSKIVSAVLSGDQAPQVKSSTNCGANTMPSNVTALMNTAVSVATLFARRHADGSPSTAIFFENVVMNAVESAPSANKSRNKFGNRNAIKKASRLRPAPNNPANTISRISPSTRLDRMAMPTTPVARVLIRRSSASAIGEQRTESADLRKQKLCRLSNHPPSSRFNLCLFVRQLPNSWLIALKRTRRAGTPSGGRESRKAEREIANQKRREDFYPPSVAATFGVAGLPALILKQLISSSEP